MPFRGERHDRLGRSADHFAPMESTRGRGRCDLLPAATTASTSRSSGSRQSAPRRRPSPRPDVVRLRQIQRYSGGEDPQSIQVPVVDLMDRKDPRAKVRRSGSARRAGLRTTKGGSGMTRTIHAFLCDQDGATAIEYALIASLIAVFLIGALSALGTNLSSEFNEVATSLK